MKKIAIILANEINDIELFVPLTIWRKAKLVVDLISIEKKNSIMTESGVKVGCNSTFDIVNTTQYHGLYIPGGKGVDRFFNQNWPVKNAAGPTKLFKTLETFRLEKNKAILLTAGSSSILDHYKLIGKTRLAGFDKEYNRDENIKEEIVLTPNLISVIGYWQLSEFALQVVDKFCGKEISKEIEASLI